MIYILHYKAIAIPSATLLKRKDAELLETLSQKLGTKFGMYTDRDEPGERLFLQLKELLPRLVHYQLPQAIRISASITCRSGRNNLPLFLNNPALSHKKAGLSHRLREMHEQVLTEHSGDEPGGSDH